MIKSLNLNPHQIDETSKKHLIIFYKHILDNAYFELSYANYKDENWLNLCHYLNIDCDQTLAENSNLLTENLKANDLFKEDPYSIPMFFLTIFIKDGEYDARNLFILKNINLALKLNLLKFEKYEDDMIHLIDSSANTAKKEFKTNNYKKYCKIAGASIVGGTLLGLTGGLIAPFLAASSGIILGSAGATLLGTTAGLSIIGSLFGLTGATLSGYKMNKRSGILKEFTFERIIAPPAARKTSAKDDKAKLMTSLSITIAVSGWVTKDCVFTTPWREMRITKESYALCWESEYLLVFGHGINYLMNWAAGTAVQEVLQQTVLSAILSSISWPLTLISLASVIDNPWGVCFARTQDAGKELANVLLSRVAGKRPVTLIGFSLGARVIYHALNYLCRLLPKKKSHLPSTRTTTDQMGGGGRSFKSGRNYSEKASSRTVKYDSSKLVSSPGNVGGPLKVSHSENTIGEHSYPADLFETEHPGDQPSKSTKHCSSNASLSLEDQFDCSKDPRGIVEDVILIGAPIPASDDDTFKKWMDVVAGTVTNCYCRTDWLLKFLYRTSSAQYNIAGLQPLQYLVILPDTSPSITSKQFISKPDLTADDAKNTDDNHKYQTSVPLLPSSTPERDGKKPLKVIASPSPSKNRESTSSQTASQHPRIINIDLTAIVNGHNDYVNKMPEILKTLGYHYTFYED